jgi:hypothetical protein
VFDMSDRKENVMRSSELLLSAAKQLFGEDIVTHAWICAWFPKFEDHSDVSGRIYSAETSCSFDPSIPNDSLSYDGQMIVFEFSNGKRVVFGNSEWAAISPFNPDEYLEESKLLQEVIDESKSE